MDKLSGKDMDRLSGQDVSVGISIIVTFGGVRNVTILPNLTIVRFGGGRNVTILTISACAHLFQQGLSYYERST